MVWVHPTRLMREGEVAMWQGGSIVWKGSVGTRIQGHDFDAVSLNVNDLRWLAAIAGELPTMESVLDALAVWWECA